MTCAQCGSAAITDGHGRDGTRTDLCDVCYWRARYEKAAQAIATANLKMLADCEQYQVTMDDGEITQCDNDPFARAPCASCPRRYIIDLQDKP